MEMAITLLLVALFLVVLEIFIPSGGLISLMAAVCGIAAIYLAFKENASMGYAFLTIAIIATPVSIVVGLHYFPRTPMGKKLILTPTKDTAQSHGRDGVSDDDYSMLLGKAGIARTNLMPSGIVEIENIRYSAVCHSGLIDINTEIEVVAVDGNSIVVDVKQI